ncbi:M20/M25/M40 family metallo-hydrolase [Peribacillus muralis]|uniref:M20/M25/M40 family metallo-hydrolase n=1 Tax=Peribacillus muralis TaxID=264697 RepID=UPI001F4E2B85|nr:M20/M25/M40 family metallo-hydrolase [Peribacillus muralis]MCK1991044.1 M20/M25/M40 family metallo-hydrolase [Peribacillus muralis]MCK2011598.1 M20/M25/M40 family metallo-hydrolase [Peribacillus muralis]
MKDFVLNDIQKDIEDIFYPYVKVKSDTYTERERDIEPFLMNFFKNITYFKDNPEHFGTYKVEEDTFDRSVCWGLVKGKGDDTVVLLHHYDVVSVEDYKTLQQFAYSPKELEAELLKIKDDLPLDAKLDLESGEFIFGRGTADMKGGGAIQLALLKRYSQMENFQGNILILAVPDEENLSAGMLSAVLLLKELKEKYTLNYSMMINSEPHQRVDKDVGVISEGSVGKMMPFFYVRGYLSHAGKVFEGFNPVNLLAEIVRRTELNVELSDYVGDEASPPPTWLYFKERKNHYDVSLPPSAGGCLSILTLNQEPASLLDRIRGICNDAFTDLISEMNQKYKIFRERINKPIEPLPWKAKVVTFKELYDEAYADYGESFKAKYDGVLQDITEKVQAGEVSIIEGNFILVEEIYNYINDVSPRVVIGLAPPYYPNVANMYVSDLSDKARNLSQRIMDYSLKQFNQQYTREYFFTGISDLSYTSIANSKIIAETLLGSMPMFGNLYSIPLEEIETLSMPCINIGPWGKEYHKFTERVLKEDLFHRSPELIHYAISTLLEWEQGNCSGSGAGKFETFAINL